MHQTIIDLQNALKTGKKLQIKLLGDSITHGAGGTGFKQDGEPIVEEFYKSFAYSEEYDIFTTQEGLSIHEKLHIVAERGNGSVIKDNTAPVEVLDGFVTRIDKSFDPRILFMILVIVLFLADIAVRKFKFKWPHEIIREYREKKSK